MGTRKSDKHQLLTRTCTNQTIKLVSAQLERFWCTDEPWENMDSQDSPWPELRGSHHLPPYSSMPSHETSTQMTFYLETLATLRGHNFVCRPPIEMRSKEKLQPLLRAFQWCIAQHLHARKSGRFFNFQWSRVKFGNLTHVPSFGHNLCLKCPNGSCKPILDIQVPRDFQ